MFVRIFYQALVITCLLFALKAHANSVWLLSKNQQHIYLIGTIHMLTPSDYPLSNVYLTALKHSEQLILETPLDEFSAPQNIQLMLKENSYPEGDNLLNHISEELEEALKSACQTVDIPLSVIARYKPAFAALMLTNAHMQKLGATATGLDEHLLTQAKELQIKTLGFETVQEHLDVLKALNEQGAENLLQNTLLELENSSTDFVAIRHAWQQGDLAALEHIFLADLKKEPLLHQILLTQRNQVWLEKLPHLVQGKTTTIAVGALHLVGENGLLAELSKQGYQLQQLKD